MNNHGGLLGRKVKLDILNDGGSPNQVVSNYQELFGKDHVDLAFGPFSSLLSGPASAVAARYGMAFVEGAGGAPSVFDTVSNQADHNTFDVSLPVADSMVPFVTLDRIACRRASGRRPRPTRWPRTRSPTRRSSWPRRCCRTSASGPCTRTSSLRHPSAYKAPAEAVAASGAQLVVLGSTDVPTVQTFMQVFEQQHYTPKLFIAASGPDQGAAFTSAVGRATPTG